MSRRVPWSSCYESIVFLKRRRGVTRFQRDGRETETIHELVRVRGEASLVRTPSARASAMERRAPSNRPSKSNAHDRPK
jgi:hypothetical protein